MSEDPPGYNATQSSTGDTGETSRQSSPNGADPPLIVGIDPGEVTGLAIYDGAALWQVTSGPFFEVLHVLEGMIAVDVLALAVVEDSRSLPIYAQHNKLRGRARDRLCRNVGRIDRDITLWEDWLKEMGIEVLMTQPSRQKKWDADLLAKITGWTLPTNQHGRDAARLVWGRRVPALQLNGSSNRS